MSKKSMNFFNNHFSAGLQVACSLLVLATCFSPLCFTTPAAADIAWSGDVDPDDPASWTPGTDAYIGNIGYGTLSVSGGDTIISNISYIGYETGSTGEVTVSGTNSTWGALDGTFIGYDGSGVLNIIGGGTLRNNGWSVIGYNSGSTGVVTVDGIGSTWTNSSDIFVGTAGNGTLNISDGGVVTAERVSLGLSSRLNFDNGTLTTTGLVFGFDNLTGTGIINTGGLASDIDLVFDATHGLNQTFHFNNPGQNITINLDANFGYMGTSVLGAGYSGVGTMNISDGRALISRIGFIGFNSGSTGVVTVDGIGSEWKASSLYVGMGGSGTLNITGGGKTITADGTIGGNYGSRGVVTVSGAGSELISIAYLLCVGDRDSGVLNILDGGLVRANHLELDYYGNGESFVNMATGGMLELSTGKYDHSGSLAEFFGNIYSTAAIRYWDYALGDWADIAEATLGEDYTLSYRTEGEWVGYTMLTVLEQVLLIGDANRDGVVSVSDYAAVQANFGSSGIAGIHGDANGDGVVSASDYASIQANYGNIAAGAGISNTPELATLFIMTIAGLGMLSRRRRGRD